MNLRLRAAVLASYLLTTSLAGGRTATATPQSDPAGAPATTANADAQLEAARTLYFESGPGEALPAFERALATYREEGNRLGEAITLGLIGNCHKRFGDYERALELLRAALEMKRELGERGEEATTLSHLGLVHWEKGDYDRAIESFEASSEIALEVGDEELRGINLNNVSLVYDELGDYRRSLEGYEQALAIYREIDFSRGEGDALGNIGGVHLLLGRYRQAADYYERALAISEREELPYSMSLDHGNLALAKLGLGQTREALAHFDRALELAAAAGAEQDEGYWLMGKGEALVTMGRIDQGLELLRLSVERSEAAEAMAEMVEALHQLGKLYALLGDAASAEAHFRRATEAAREIGLSRGVTFGLLALGDLDRRRERYEQAEALYREAGRRAEEAGEKVHLASSLLRLSETYREQDRLDEAGDAAERAAEIARRTQARPAEAEALHALAEVERLRGRTDAALALFGDAETIAVEIRAPHLAWRIKHGQGRALEQAGRLAEAADALQQAVSIIESVRGRLEEDRFRAGYLQDKYQVYVDLVRVLLASGRIDQAFASAERLRARSYLELISHGPPIAGTEEQRRREIELRERVRQLQRAVEAERERSGSEYRQRAVDLFSAELLAAESEYQTLLDDLGRTDRGAARLRSPIAPTAAQVQAALSPGQSLLEYVVDQDRLILFVLTADSLRSKEVAIERPALAARVELLNELMLRPGGDAWRRPARALAETLVEPALGEGWLEGAQGLVVVPQGVLHRVPFAALLLADDGGEVPMVERFDLAVLPAAATLLEGGGARAATESMLALAPERAGLRFAPEEVRRVAELFDSDSLVLVGDGARESTFKSLARDYRVLHLASHGYFNQLNPLLSGLELEADATDDGYLEAHEIMGLDLSAQLVTLSACDTGRASGHFAEIPTGEELVGLTRAFLAAGSRAVLSTLWRINDRSTVAMMQSFYRHLNGSEEPGSAATTLAEAQRAMLRSGPYAHPYYWASFTLVGADAR